MKNLILISAVLSIAFLHSCSDDDVPEAEPNEEIITEVSLIFTSVEGGSPLVYRALDPDGEGVNDLEPEGAIFLDTSTSYQLFIELQNTISGEDIGEEVEEEGAEHMFFFGFSDGIFAYPDGNGNLDERTTNAVEYLDEDENGQPIGLITAWVTGDEATGTLRLVLKHQPQTKSDTSTAADGSSDLDVTWDVVVN